MKKFKNPFGLYENKEIIYIKNGDYESKEKYKNCYCPECGEKLIPRMGQKNAWHFSHANNKNCDGNFETSLHLYAKQIIKDNNKILLPELRIFQYVEFNKMDNNFMTDLHKWENINQERVMEQKILEENVYSYKWIENESKIRDFIPDCIVEINGQSISNRNICNACRRQRKREQS